jgi:hypothetical protein
LSACPQCGQENKEGAKFCIKCGAQLEAPAQAAAPPPAAAAAAPPAAAPPPAPPPQAVQPPQAAPPPQAAQPTYQQPAQYTQPMPPPGAYPQQQYAAPPVAPYPAPYAQAPAYAVKTRGGLFWVGALITLVTGVMVLVSSFMAWISGPFGLGSISGWDLVTNDAMKISNGFFEYGNGYPLFSGLCPLILGSLIALIAVLMLIFRSRGLGGLAILFSILALGMAITNLTSILRDPTGVGLGVGVGIYIFLIFSFTGLVGGGMAASG